MSQYALNLQHSTSQTCETDHFTHCSFKYILIKCTTWYANYSYESKIKWVKKYLNLVWQLNKYNLKTTITIYPITSLLYMQVEITRHVHTLYIIMSAMHHVLLKE